MKNNIKQLALAAVIATGVSSINASAAVIDITGAPLSIGSPYNTTFNLDFSNYYGAVANATDTIYFKLDGTYHVSISADTFNFSRKDISFNQLNLLKVNPSPAPADYILGDISGPYDYIASATYDYNYIGPNDAAHPVESYNNTGYNPKLTLGPGEYQVNFLTFGEKNTTGLGTFNAHLSVSAVPEPETYAMMLAGLGLIGFSARRRKTQA